MFFIPPLPILLFFLFHFLVVSFFSTPSSFYPVFLLLSFPSSSLLLPPLLLLHLSSYTFIISPSSSPPSSSSSTSPLYPFQLLFSPHPLLSFQSYSSLLPPLLFLHLPSYTLIPFPVLIPSVFLFFHLSSLSFPTFILSSSSLIFSIFLFSSSTAPLPPPLFLNFDPLPCLHPLRLPLLSPLLFLHLTFYTFIPVFIASYPFRFPLLYPFHFLSSSSSTSSFPISLSPPLLFHLLSFYSSPPSVFPLLNLFFLILFNFLTGAYFLILSFALFFFFIHHFVFS
ncbi:unnamed protein product [Acanthosepion pharaonis]|uniref:Uncharacterized protein n=1 Tax=Acanthosepion pharaonis TaxID=158019 RepID=A0A812CKH7_ACAPH|nr:unnamed protein product [Sepia pharaonis]